MKWYQDEINLEGTPEGILVFVVGMFDPSDNKVEISIEIFNESTNDTKSVIFYTNQRKSKMQYSISSEDLFYTYQNAVKKVHSRLTNWSEFNTLFEIARLKHENSSM